VEALLTQPRSSHWAAVGLPLGALAAATATIISAGRNLEDLFELARHL
jgi:hypothetical protein